MAVDARYGGDELFNQDPNLKLATNIVSRNGLFAEVMGKVGHFYQFEDNVVNAPTTKQDTAGGKAAPAGTYLTTRCEEPHGDIDDILCQSESLPLYPKAGILEWLTEVYEASRGFEMGTFDPSLLVITMGEQSKKWSRIALGYISDVATVVHRFITNLLRIICADERVLRGLTQLLIGSLREQYKKTVAQVNFILQVEASKPTTHNHYFNDNLEKWCVVKPLSLVHILMLAEPTEATERWGIGKGPFDQRPWKYGQAGRLNEPSSNEQYQAHHSRSPRHLEILLSGCAETRCRCDLYAGNRPLSSFRAVLAFEALLASFCWGHDHGTARKSRWRRC